MAMLQQGIAAAQCLGKRGSRIIALRGDLTQLPPRRRANFGFCRTFQISNLFPGLTMQQNMAPVLRRLSSRKFSFFGKAVLAVGEEEAAEHALGLSRLPACRCWSANWTSCYLWLIW